MAHLFLLRNPGLCIYTVLQAVQRPGVCSDPCGTVHCKEP